jgi:hypothetical protein
MAFHNSVRSLEPIHKHPYDDRVYRVDCRGALRPGDTIATVDNVIVPAALTVSDEQVNTAAFDNGHGSLVQPGEGIELRVTGGERRKKYEIDARWTTTAGEKLGAYLDVVMD